MALDLFANFERASNSSLFYRLTSASPYTVSIKLSDLLLLDEELGTRYYVTSALNNEPPAQFVSNNVDYTFQTSHNFNCTTPCICSITVSVSTASPDFVPVAQFQLSSVFVEDIPTANFIAYPSAVIKNVGGTVQKVTLTSSNYIQSEGVMFYGEGHTEVINLSSTSSNGLTSNWFVGNNTPELLDVTSRTSELSVVHINLATSTAIVTSSPDLQANYPISLLVTTNSILSSAPLLTYEDSTGNLMFYPFFTSTQNITGGPSPLNNYLKEDIEIKNYPNATPVSFNSPFTQTPFSLPFDYSSQKFLGIITVAPASGILAESFVGSKWGVQGVSEIGEWGGEYDSFAGTSFLPNIYAYQFRLSYDKDVILDYFKSSSIYDTTISVYCSATKTVVISAAPYDWLPKQDTQMINVSAMVSPIPFAKLFIKNYFNIKNNPVEIFSVGIPSAPYQLENVVLQSELSPTTLTLSGSVLSGIMVFDQIGVADLSATALLKNTDTNVVQTTIVVFPAMTEIVQQYDVVETEYFQTEFTPVVLPYSQNPRMTPNEWAVADNVNSIVEKMHNTLDELNKYTKLYSTKNKFYGWFGPKGSSDIPIETPSSVYVWQDLECPANTESEATWAVLECESTNFPLTWEYHECGESQSDPTCLGKYCIEWKWKSRRCNVSELNVKWKDTKCTSSLAKKWKFEKCETDSESLNCDRDNWKVSTIDPQYFPIPSCSFTQRCSLVDVEHIGSLDRLVIAYPTEIQLIKTDYIGTYVARRGAADDLFSFQKIVGVASDENTVFVLDSVLSKVSVFSIKEDSFKFIASWGTFGLATAPQGLNAPNDIHVDQDHDIWIADTGNECVKKFTFNGKNRMILISSKFNNNSPISVCVDSQKNIHCLTLTAVYVFNFAGAFLFEYKWPNTVINPKKINTSFNREVIYLTHNYGITKFFRTGTLFENLLNDYKCGSGAILQGYNSITQDKFRNVYVTIGDKILKIPDLMRIIDVKAAISKELYWDLNEILVHKEEYIQPWVYLKSFHRLWDNIELFRTSLFYSETGCKSHRSPVYSKEDLIIGQNEIVTNAVINRLSNQLWTNLELLFDYFDPTCSENG